MVVVVVGVVIVIVDVVVVVVVVVVVNPHAAFMGCEDVKAPPAHVDVHEGVPGDDVGRDLSENDGTLVGVVAEVEAPVRVAGGEEEGPV